MDFMRAIELIGVSRTIVVLFAEERANYGMGAWVPFPYL